MKKLKKLLFTIWMLLLIIPISVVGFIFAVLKSLYYFDAQEGVDFWKDNF